jgi:hypothetical protein
LRTIGFATTPGLFCVFGIMPGATWPVFAASYVWMLVAMVVGIRQALDYRSTGRAVLVAVAGWVVYLAIVFALLHAAAGSIEAPPPGTAAV